jgi:hypothetical protein
MRTINSFTPISVACDLSEAAIEQAYEQLGKYEQYYYLYVSPELVSEARRLKSKFPWLKYIRVRLDFDTDVWALAGQYSGIFSEGA